MLRACLQSPLTHPLCLSSCKQHEAFQAATAVVTAAEAEQREAEEEQGAEPDEKSESEDDEPDAQGGGGTGSTARLRGKRVRKEPDWHDPNRENNRPQRATAAKKKHQTRTAAGYRDNDVDALFRAEVEKFTSSLAAELARR